MHTKLWAMPGYGKFVWPYPAVTYTAFVEAYEAGAVVKAMSKRL